MSQSSDNTPSKGESNELLSCPFCGGEAGMLEHYTGKAEHSGYVVACNNEACPLESFGGFIGTNDKAAAIAAWNTRAPSHAEALACGALNRAGGMADDIILLRAALAKAEADIDKLFADAETVRHEADEQRLRAETAEAKLAKAEEHIANAQELAKTWLDRLVKAREALERIELSGTYTKGGVHLCASSSYADECVHVIARTALAAIRDQESSKHGYCATCKGPLDEKLFCSVCKVQHVRAQLDSE